MVVANLEAQLANLKAKRTVLASYQSTRSPDALRVASEIKALNQQIAQERARMAQQSGGALNVMSSEYQTLELQAQFAQDSYSGALAALENTRIEAARKLKQVSVLQSPRLPEYSVEPRRLYNSVVFAIIALFLGLILHMLVLIIKDHRD
jgi:capsular polysaccharide transport system permease protein